MENGVPVGKQLTPLLNIKPPLSVSGERRRREFSTYTGASLVSGLQFLFPTFV